MGKNTLRLAVFFLVAVAIHVAVFLAVFGLHRDSVGFLRWGRCAVRCWILTESHVFLAIA